MKLTPLDVRKQEFKKAMRGYDPVEVDTFLEMVAADMEEMLRDQKETREKALQLETQLKDYRQIEKTLQQTLMQAQEATGKTYESARREAESIIKEAEVRASAIADGANRDLAKVANEINELKVRRESLIARLRVLLSTELDLLKTLDQRAPDVLAPDPSYGAGKEHLDVESIVQSINNDRPQKQD